MVDTLNDYKNLVVAYLRDFESSRMAGDPEKLRRLTETPDDLLLKKWLWTGAITGGIVSFGILWPLAALVLAPFITSFIMQPLWMLIEFAMGFSLILLITAIYFTFKNT